jgi:hypothetical protein
MLIINVVIEARNKARTKNGKINIKPTIIEKVFIAVQVAAT